MQRQSNLKKNEFNQWIKIYLLEQILKIQTRRTIYLLNIVNQ